MRLSCDSTRLQYALLAWRECRLPAQEGDELLVGTIAMLLMEAGCLLFVSGRDGCKDRAVFLV